MGEWRVLVSTVVSKQSQPTAKENSHDLRPINRALRLHVLKWQVLSAIGLKIKSTITQ